MVGLELINATIRVRQSGNVQNTDARNGHGHGGARNSVVSGVECHLRSCVWKGIAQHRPPPPPAAGEGVGWGAGGMGGQGGDRRLRL